MSVWAELYDAGTTMVIDPLATSIPGMDYGYYRELDMEYQWPGERAGAINQLLRETALSGTFRPWPKPFPWRMWIDYTPRYEGEDGGFKTNLYHWDSFFDSYNPTVADLAQVETEASYEPNVDRRFERMARMKTPAEIAAAETEEGAPTEWLRTLVYNEPGAKHGSTCQLLEPATINHDLIPGYEYKMKLDYNPLFAPVNFNEPDWYDLHDENGVQLPTEDKVRRLAFAENGSYRLYLRPANWRWVAQVWATYIYVSWFEMFPTRLVFTTAWFNRPPIYPDRHDLIHSSQVADFEWQNVYYSTDSGISSGFNSSRGAQFLRYQIIDAQWWTQSEAFIFAGNDPATLVLWLYPPEAGDIVLGIGEVDRVTGAEQVFWVKQNRDLTDEYQRTVIGSYIILDFTVAG